MGAATTNQPPVKRMPWLRMQGEMGKSRVLPCSTMSLSEQPHGAALSAAVAYSQRKATHVSGPETLGPE
jgi:hypothetical protein